MFPEVSLAYVMCGAARTGSTLLADALWNTGRAGKPAEYFDPRGWNLANWRRKFNIDDDSEYFAKVVAGATTENGIFGFKLHGQQLGELRKMIALGMGKDAATLQNLSLDQLLALKFGAVRYLWVFRKNKVAQGISYYRAEKTDVWRKESARTVGQEMLEKQQARDAALDFNFEQIDRYVRLVTDYDLRWMALFRERQLKPLVIAYEDFIKAYERAVRAALTFLGIPHADMAIPGKSLAQQADERSIEWERRYIAMKRGQTVVPIPPVSAAIVIPDAALMREGAPLPASAATAAAAAVPASVTAAAPPAEPPTEEVEERELPLIAYTVSEYSRMPIVPAPSRRAWMDPEPRRVMYRCLPLLIANQDGWLILNPHQIVAVWNGGEGLNALTVTYPKGDPPPRFASSHFGFGILTFHIAYLFRTPPGYNLYARGPANMPKDGIAPLEGIVETDWLQASFTMNWKLTRPGLPVIFEEGDPICMITPMRRGEIERFRPEIRPLAADPELEAGYKAWSKSRDHFNATLKQPASDARKQGRQLHYVRGLTVTQQRAPEHQTGLTLASFVDKTK